MAKETPPNNSTEKFWKGMWGKKKAVICGQAELVIWRKKMKK